MSTVADHLPQYSHDFENSGADMNLGSGFNGATEYGSQFSFTCRFKRETSNQLQYLLDHRSSTINTGWYVRINSNGRVRIALGASWISGGAAVGDVWAATVTTLNNPRWHEVIAVFDFANPTVADRLRIYIDGSRASISASNIPTQTLTPRHKNGRIRIGADLNVASGFDGLMYNIAASTSGNIITTSDTQESDGTAKDLKDFVGLSFHPTVDAGAVTTDWVIADWSNGNSLVLSSTLGDDTI